MAKIQTNGSGSVYTVNGSVLLTDDSGGGSGEYQLRRVTDDSNNEIGTAFMQFTDSSNNKYDVVCLDAQYRNNDTTWCSTASTITNLPIYDSNYNLWWYDNAKETATQNTQLILDFCTAGGYTSTACSHCRLLSFTINGTIYYGQLPNIREVFDMWRHRVRIEQMDTSASSHVSTNFSSSRYIWSSSQYSSYYSWHLNNSGTVMHAFKTTTYGFACPVLEIPA